MHASRKWIAGMATVLASHISLHCVATVQSPGACFKRTEAFHPIPLVAATRWRTFAASSRRHARRAFAWVQQRRSGRPLVSVRVFGSRVDWWWQSCCSTMCCLQVCCLACSAWMPHFQPVLIVPASVRFWLAAEAQIRELSALNEQLQKQASAAAGGVFRGGMLSRVLAAHVAIARSFTAGKRLVCRRLWRTSSHPHSSGALLAELPSNQPYVLPASLPHRLRRRRRHGSRWSRSDLSWSGECTGGALDSLSLFGQVHEMVGGWACSTARSRRVTVCCGAQRSCANGGLNCD